MSFDFQIKTPDGEKAYPLAFYPVGSIYMSVNNVDPTNLFGGTWERIEDCFLLAAGSTYAAGDTGGAATQTVNFANGTAKIGFTAANPNIHMSGGGTFTPASNSITGAGNWGASTAGTTQVRGAALQGTQSLDNMPPYLAVYMWRRTA